MIIRYFIERIIIVFIRTFFRSDNKQLLTISIGFVEFISKNIIFISIILLIQYYLTEGQLKVINLIIALITSLLIYIIDYKRRYSSPDHIIKDIHNLVHYNKYDKALRKIDKHFSSSYLEFLQKNNNYNYKYSWIKYYSAICLHSCDDKKEILDSIQRFTELKTLFKKDENPLVFSDIHLNLADLYRKLYELNTINTDSLSNYNNELDQAKLLLEELYDSRKYKSILIIGSLYLDLYRKTEVEIHLKTSINLLEAFYDGSGKLKNKGFAETEKQKLYKNLASAYRELYELKNTNNTKQKLIDFYSTLKDVYDSSLNRKSNFFPTSYYTQCTELATIYYYLWQLTDKPEYNSRAEKIFSTIEESIVYKYNSDFRECFKITKNKISNLKIN
ncbi:hypothetical protein [Vallitalea okinawensis]|uniref:hypothetical protein n=1 Tax=Vallitalea okinawensis TaxID=2078660 RepID=UPI000CFB5BAD|nr:hypothetical protein [Vallitalea okinawensis]